MNILVIFSIVVVVNYLFVGRNIYIPVYAYLSRNPVSSSVSSFSAKVYGQAADQLESAFHLRVYSESTFFESARKNSPIENIRLASAYSFIVPSVLGFLYFGYSDFPQSGSHLSGYPSRGQVIAHKYYPLAFVLLSLSIHFVLKLFNVGRTRASIAFSLSFLCLFVLLPQFLMSFSEELRQTRLGLYIFSVVPWPCHPVSLYPLLIEGTFGCGNGPSTFGVPHVLEYFSIALLSLYLGFFWHVGPIRALLIITFLQIVFYWRIMVLAVFGVDLMDTGLLINSGPIPSLIAVNIAAMLAFIGNGLADFFSTVYSIGVFKSISRTADIRGIIMYLVYDLLFALLLIALNFFLFVLGVVALGYATGDSALLSRSIDYLASPFHHPFKSLALYLLVISPIWPSVLVGLFIVITLILHVLTVPIQILQRRLSEDGGDEIKILGVPCSGADLFILQVSFLIAIPTSWFF